MKYIITAIFYFLFLEAVSAQPGQLDPSFGDNGIVRNMDFEWVNGLITQVDGKLVVAARHDEYYSGLIRYTENGTIDSTFGINGIAKSEILLNYSGGIAGTIGHNLLIQPNGCLVICGYTWDWTLGYVPALQRFDTNGIVDSSFGENGIVIDDIPVDNNPMSFIALHNDKITMVCYTSSKTFVYRFNNNGTKDFDFSDDGILKFPSGDPNSDFIPRDIEVDAGGRILLAGVFDPIYSDSSAGIICIDYYGNPDHSFSGDGFLKINLSYLAGQLYDLEIQDDGKIVATGCGGDWPAYYYSVLRVNSNGSMDSTFGINGVMTDLEDIYPKAIIIQPDQKIVVAAHKYLSWVSVMRLTSSGSIDSTFGMNGISITEIGQDYQYASNLVIQPNGKIVFSGYTDFGWDEDSIFLMRYFSDSTFATSITPVKKDIFFVYPNPASKAISVDVALFKKPFLLTIRDISGRVVKQHKASSNSLSTIVTIEIEDLHKGIYIVDVLSDNKRWIGKFVKE